MPDDIAKRAKRLADGPNAVAALLGERRIDHRDFKHYLDEIVEQIADGRASRGVTLKELAAGALATPRHLQAKLERWTPHAELVAILTMLGTSGTPLYDELRSVPVRVGARQEKRVGTDATRGVGRSLTLLVCTTVLADRCLPRYVTELNVDTRWDHSSSRADPALIADGERRAGRPLPGTVGEHIAHVLEHERALLDEALDCAAGEDMDELAAQLRHLSTRILLVDGLSTGPPVHRWDDSAYTRHPGREAGAEEAVRSAGRRAVLACGAPTTAEREALAARRCVTLRPRPRGAAAAELGFVHEEAVTYHWLPGEGTIVRSCRSAGGARRSVFRPVGVADARLPEILPFVERMQHGRDGADALQRWEKACGPGLARVHRPATATGLYSLLNAANAALAGAG